MKDCFRKLAPVLFVLFFVHVFSACSGRSLFPLFFHSVCVFLTNRESETGPRLRVCSFCAVVPLQRTQFPNKPFRQEAFSPQSSHQWTACESAPDHIKNNTPFVTHTKSYRKLVNSKKPNFLDNVNMFTFRSLLVNKLFKTYILEQFS